MNAALAPTSSSTTHDALTPFTRVPQVNLLPPELAAARGLRVVKLWSALALAVVVLLVGLAYAYSAFELAQARGDLSAVQDENARLTAEQAQYWEVPVVLGELNDLTATRQLATSTEVLWKPYLEQIRAALPQGAELRTLQVAGATPVTAPAPPMDTLQSQAMGQLTLTAVTPTMPNAADWTDALETIPGLVDARVQSMARVATETSTGYNVTMTMQYDETALSGRFAPTEEDR